jgi:hypothetical protein
MLVPHSQGHKAGTGGQGPDTARWEEIGWAFCCALNRARLEQDGFRLGNAVPEAAGARVKARCRGRGEDVGGPDG